MSEKGSGDPRDTAGAPDAPALTEFEAPFGPRFFASQLRVFARDRCPQPAEHLPVVRLHLADGEVLDLCHIIGLARGWVALAVYESEAPSRGPAMRTELVPYQAIHRVTIHVVRPGEVHAGFDLHSRPRPILEPGEEARRSPEEMLHAASEPPEGRR